MMAMREPVIGETVAYEPKRRPLSTEPLDDPEWFILTTPPQREVAARAWLERIGVAETWFPTEEAWKSVRGQSKQVAYQRRIVPGYIFALFDREPVWDVMFEQGRGKISGVVGVYERPYAVPMKVMQAMKLVPERIERIRQAETAREKAIRLARLPAVGQRATLTIGPLAGRIVQVERIDRGIAAFIMEGVRGTAAIEALERQEAAE